MNVAVTGATGFLGKLVVQELRQRGVNVAGFSRGHRKDHSNGHRVLDIKAPPENLFEYLGHPEVLIHLAWDNLPNYREQSHLGEEFPQQERFLKDVISQGLKNLFVAGTCFEYGMQEGALSETAPALPDNPYGQAKVNLLNSLVSNQKSENFNLVWGRLFYMYGEGQSPNSLWPQFCKAANSGASEFKMSGGQQIRDFLPATEIARLIVELSLMKRDIGVVNICSGKPTTVEALVRGWAKELRWNGTLQLGHYPYPDYEPMEFWGERSRLDNLLAS